MLVFLPLLGSEEHTRCALVRDGEIPAENGSDYLNS